MSMFRSRISAQGHAYAVWDCAEGLDVHALYRALFLAVNEKKVGLEQQQYRSEPVSRPFAIGGN